MKAPILLLLVFLVALGTQDARVRVVFETEAGEIEIEVDTARAPVTSANFLTYVDDGLFDGGSFYRTVRPDNQQEKPVKIAVIQAQANRQRRAEFPAAIPLERTNVTGLAHKNGTVSMARAGQASDNADSLIGDWRLIADCRLAIGDFIRGLAGVMRATG